MSPTATVAVTLVSVAAAATVVRLFRHRIAKALSTVAGALALVAVVAAIAAWRLPRAIRNRWHFAKWEADLGEVPQQELVKFYERGER